MKPGLETKSNMKLHLGAFDQPVAGWINTDITPHLFIARVPFLAFVLYKLGILSEQRYSQHRKGIFRQLKYLNVTNKFPYQDNTFDAVFSCHLFEHLYPDEALFCLREIYRILHPKGVCRIVIPDLDKMVQQYDATNPDKFLKEIFATQKRVAIKNAHHWHYNTTSLTQRLRDVGFSTINVLSYRVGACPDIEKLDNRPESSIFVEGIK